MIVEHHIQRDILKRLVKKESCRFSDLKDKTIESNLFMYHLRQLIRAKLVQKVDDGYSLTSAGKHYADRSNLPSMRLRLQPKQITILVVRAGDDEYILLKRKHLPYLDYVGFPSGKIHYGETLQQAAKRELTEKTGLDNVALTLRGNILMRFKDEQNEIVSHISGYVFTGQADINTLMFKSEFFDSYVGSKTDLYTQHTFKGHKEILGLLENNDDKLFVSECDFIADF